MARLTAFDSKDYKRSSKGELKHFTPLGCGITFVDADGFSCRYNEKLEEISRDFGMPRCCGAFSPKEYFDEIGPGKATRISFDLMDSVVDYVDSVFVSYVVLPPKDYPRISVGGYRSSELKIPTFDFLRTLSNYYVYVTAWHYTADASNRDDQLLLDGFRGNQTYAWEDLRSQTELKVYSHGDECNPFISLADIFAFLTDKKLYDEYQKLDPASVEKVWSNYPFKVETRFLDHNVLSKIRWYTDSQIDYREHYAKPTIFLYSEGYNMENIKQFDVYAHATKLASEKNGCVRGFDRGQDSKYVKDGDYFFYAGQKAKVLGETLNDIYDITVLPLRELRK
jgi:hypothetical protein